MAVEASDDSRRHSSLSLGCVRPDGQYARTPLSCRSGHRLSAFAAEGIPRGDGALSSILARYECRLSRAAELQEHRRVLPDVGRILRAPRGEGLPCQTRISAVAMKPHLSLLAGVLA